MAERQDAWLNRAHSSDRLPEASEMKRTRFDLAVEKLRGFVAS
jgi:hypothetical protein